MKTIRWGPDNAVRSIQYDDGDDAAKPTIEELRWVIKAAVGFGTQDRVALLAALDVAEACVLLSLGPHGPVYAFTHTIKRPAAIRPASGEEGK